jgi:hypothetical protein
LLSYPGYSAALMKSESLLPLPQSPKYLWYSAAIMKPEGPLLFPQELPSASASYPEPAKSCLYPSASFISSYIVHVFPLELCVFWIFPMHATCPAHWHLWERIRLMRSVYLLVCNSFYSAESHPTVRMNVTPPCLAFKSKLYKKASWDLQQRSFVSCWFVAWLILWPWRLRQHVTPKCRLTFNGLLLEGGTVCNHRWEHQIIQRKVEHVFIFGGGDDGGEEEE